MLRLVVLPSQSLSIDYPVLLNASPVEAFFLFDIKTLLFKLETENRTGKYTISKEKHP